MKKITYYFLNTIYFSVLFVSYLFCCLFALFVAIQIILLIKDQIIWFGVFPAGLIFFILFKYREKFISFFDTFKEKKFDIDL